MDTLIQIIYISRSTFAPAKVANGIEPNVGRILVQSRANNRRNGLVGVLYFGDDCFFQCLEGKEEAVNTLYAKLEKDQRHKDLKIISRKTITQLSFSDWAMKYVPLEKSMTELLQRGGYERFDPYVFSPEMTQNVMRFLRGAADESTTTRPVAVQTTEPVRKQVAVAEKPGNPALMLSIISLVVSLAALAVALFK